MPRTIPTSIRLTREEKRAVARVADKQGVGLTTIIQEIVREWAAAREKEIEDKKFAKEMRDQASKPQ
jgi:predicted DNA-binding protein